MTNYELFICTKIYYSHIRHSHIFHYLMLLKIHPDNPGERHLKIIVDCLKSGGIIIYPSDTVYGLGCDITKIKAVDRIAQIKGIKREKANFSFVCHSLSHLSDFTRPIPNPVYKLMRRMLPGPFTFILNASNNVPHFFQSKKKTVGIRIPDHQVPVQIVEKLGNPIMTTSIHDVDEMVDYLTDPELIYEKFHKLVDIVIDSGHCGNIPSTIIDCTGDEPLVVRKGKGETDELVSL
jgi:tRNA threonylcarbamoyl adenosine modification protein (Sua5/YciO/YrdC/YwlC family)